MSKPAAVKDGAASGAPASKSLVSKLKIPGIIVGIVVAEWVVASFYLPSSSPAPAVSADAAEGEDEEAADSHDAHDDHAPAASHGHGDHGAEKGGHGGGHGDKPVVKAPSHSEQSEVDLGEFTVTGYQPVSNTTMFITFHLYGTIKHKHADEFTSRLEESKHRVRENVIVIIRSAEITDLTDAGLGLIKRRILETTNKTLGKPLLLGVVFSDFSFVEQ